MKKILTTAGLIATSFTIQAASIETPEQMAEVSHHIYCSMAQDVYMDGKRSLVVDLEKLSKSIGLSNDARLENAANKAARSLESDLGRWDIDSLWEMNCIDVFSAHPLFEQLDYK